MAQPQKLNLVKGGDPSAGATYSSIDPSRISYIEIFPPVGISRFGDSEKEYFLAPEVPGYTHPPAGVKNFRDDEQKIRRQAVRFRVYAYDAQNNVLGEVNNKVTLPNSNYTYTLTWTVHVANKKAANHVFNGRLQNPPITTLRNPNIQADYDLDERTQLIVDPGPVTITNTGPDYKNLQGTFQGSSQKLTDVNTVYLGQIQVDAAGRLIFVGGTGHSKSVGEPLNLQPEIVSEFDSADWIDTACDGWVSVSLVAQGIISCVSKHKATVVGAPTDFAWGIHAPTTLYDIMEYIYTPQVPPGTVVNANFFTKYIYPVLSAPGLISWTNNFALQGHGPLGDGSTHIQKIITVLQKGTKEAKDDLKTRIFQKLRKPNYEDPSQADDWFMPRLSGDNGDMPDPGQFPAGLQPDIARFAALTALQYERFRLFKDTDFTLPSNYSPEPTITRIEDLTKDKLKEQPEYLTRASLQTTIGDPLFPGIEMYWVAKLPTTYDLTVKNITPPFRVNYPPAPKKESLPEKSYIKPGHLTWGLSLPWQCDFDLCNTHWWPSVRPDAVVTKVAFDNTMGKYGTKEQFNEAVVTRKDWTRGFRKTLDLGQSRSSTDIPWFESTDMVRYWTNLGIVRQQQTTYPVGETDPKKQRTITAFLESERLL